MSTYMKGLILTVVICNLILLFTPELNGDGLKRYIKYLCGLVVLLALLSPLLRGWNGLDVVSQGIKQFFTPPESVSESTGDRVKKAYTEGTVRETAYAVITWLSGEYGIPTEHISVEMRTESPDEEKISVEEIRVLLYNCGPADREKIHKALSEMLDCRVLVMGREKEIQDENSRK